MTGRVTVLLVDKDSDFTASLARDLDGVADTTTIGVMNGLAAMDTLRSTNVNIVVADYGIADINGVILLETVKRKWPDVLRVILTDDNGGKIADAVNRGVAHKVLRKSQTDNLVQIRELINECRTIRPPPPDPPN